ITTEDTEVGTEVSEITQRSTLRPLWLTPILPIINLTHMSIRNDIASMDDIRLLVDSFYGAVQQHPLLAPIFNGVIGGRWPEHLEKMYRFWQTVLLGEHTYYGSPFPPHAKLPVGDEHFRTWLALWHAAIDRHFSGPKADEAKWRGDKMAVMFLSKINHYQNSSAVPLI